MYALSTSVRSARSFSTKQFLWGGAVILAALVLVEQLTPIKSIYVDPVTPWNPLVGACVAIAVGDRRLGMLLAFAVTIAGGLIAWPDSGTMMLSFLKGVVIAAEAGAISAIAALASRRLPYQFAKSPLLSAMTVSPFAVAGFGLIFVGALMICGVITTNEFAPNFVRFWVGEIVGIVIFTPLFAPHLVPAPKLPLTAAIVFEGIFLGIIVVSAAWLAFGENPQIASRYLFVVFIPMIWIVLRYGLRGAIALNVLLQVSLIGSLMIAGHEEANITLFQALLLILSTSSFTFGLAVEQSNAAVIQLRAREEEFSASLRVGAAGELAGTLAHELAHPLGAMSNYASALNHVIRQVAPDNVTAAAISGKLSQEITRATDTLHRMREFFRTGRLVVENVDMSAVVKESVTLLKDRLGHNAISPYIVAEGGAPIVLGDKIQLRAVVYNLLVNAIDALKPIAPEKRVLKVTLRRSGGFVSLEVEDSGGGVAEDVREHIFEPLVTTKEHGLGLGLSMSKSVLAAHDGRISVTQSSLGGAKFVISLPGAT